MPSIHGEDAVIRILDKESLNAAFRSLRLDVLGFSEADLRKLRKYITEPYGMVVATGPTGSGKTAVKFGINRYVQSNTTGVAQLFDQAAGAVNSTTRAWNDQTFPVGDPRRNNFLPDCNLVATTANGECGAMANPNFGTYVPVNSPDPEWITGWGKRTYSWQTSVNVDRELLPNVVMNVGYFRTWYGNFMVTDNRKVTPADYSPYCVTVPVDARLPLSGQPLCGLYDINPTAFGQVDNLITRNNNYGTQKEIYNGVDVNFQARFRKATLGGAETMYPEYREKLKAMPPPAKAAPPARTGASNAR